MSENGLSYQICKNDDDLKSAKDGYQAVMEGLGRNIVSKTGNQELGRTLQVFVRDKKNRVVGGVIGLAFGGWLYVSLLWVEESLRNKGHGARLLGIIEDEAVKLGCKYAHLDTYSFEAKPFYEKHGYTLFATLENYPEGHSKHFLKKNLLQSSAEHLAVPADATDADSTPALQDLEARVLAALSILESGRQLDSGEYVLPGGRRAKPNVEGVKSLLKDGAKIQSREISASAERLLELGFITRRADCYFLSGAGKKLGARLRKERISKSYDNLLLRTENSKAYSAFCRRVFGKDLSQFNVLDMEQLNTLVEKLELKPNELALDLGCGNGRITEYISDLTGAKIVGLDFAAELMKNAQRRTAGKKDRLTYMVGDMDDLRFDERSFDAVISIDTLYFVENIDTAIRKLKSLLKPTNGRIAIFYDQSIEPNESRDILHPENTKVGKALSNNDMVYETIDYTENSRGIWVREIEAAEELKELFAREGNIDIYEDRAQDAKNTLEKIKSGRQVRHFYLAKTRM